MYKTHRKKPYSSKCGLCGSEMEIDEVGNYHCPNKTKKSKVYVVNETNLLMKDNHTLGCNLENYADVLRYRGFEKEANDLDLIASRIK